MTKLLSITTLGFAMLAQASFGYELTCVRDASAVDGAYVQVKLQLNETGRGTLKITEVVHSRAVNASEVTVLHAVLCDIRKGSEIQINCDGPYKVDVSEMELVSPGGQGFSRKVIVSTTYKDKSFNFSRGPIGTGPIKNGCELRAE